MASHSSHPTSKTAKKPQAAKLSSTEANSVEPDASSADTARRGRREAVRQDENTIRVLRTRIRSTPAQGERPTSPDAPRSSLESDSRAVPEHINARYIKVGNKYHFTNGDLAFKDRGRRLSTRLENTEVIRDLIAIAKERGWDGIAIDGTERFRKEAWQQAKLAGLSTRGYRPSELERAQLARLIGREREEARETLIPHSTAPSERPTTRPTAAEEAVRAETRSSAQGPERVHVGRLLDHGAANYRHDRHADLSYFVKLDTPDGERTLWGKDLERAVAQSLSRVKPGNEVVVRQSGAKPVTVIRPVRDEEGRIVDRAQVQTHLNRWLVERTDFLKDRAEVAQIVRDPSIDAKTAAAKRPELAGTYTELHAAKLIAQDLYAHPADRERFITRVREAIADEIERGEPLSAPRIKTPAPSREALLVRTQERAQERALN
jgi:antitoxin (DNA-binding transcriptional repressor) of toxin-antitoxin stability system